MKKTILYTSLLAGAFLPAQAAILAQYDLTVINDANETADTFTSPTVDVNPNSIATALTSPSTHNGGAVNPEFGDVYDNNGNQALGWSARGNNPAQTFQIINPTDSFVSFDLTLSTAFNLTTLTLDSGVFTTQGANTGFDYTASFSLDGSTFTPIATITAGSNPGDAAFLTGNGTDVKNISFDLSGVTDLQSASGQIFFQIDPVSTVGGAQNGVQSQRAGFIDNLILNGAAVPEPSSTALLGLGGLALLLRRRK